MTPSLAQIEAIALQTLATLPTPFRGMAQTVVVQVEDWPPADLLGTLGISDPLELTGLYEGVPLTEKSVSDPANLPDIIWLFRHPILDEWHSRSVTLEELVRHITIHELAHHLGWSDEDIAQIDRWWE